MCPGPSPGASLPSAISLQRSPSHRRPTRSVGSAREQGWAPGATRQRGCRAERTVRPPSSSCLFPGLCPGKPSPTCPGRQPPHHEPAPLLSFISWNSDVYLRLGHREPRGPGMLLCDCSPVNYSRGWPACRPLCQCKEAAERWRFLLSTFTCILPAKMVLRGKAPKTRAGGSWRLMVGHLCLRFLLGHAGWPG